MKELGVFQVWDIWDRSKKWEKLVGTDLPEKPRIPELRTQKNPGFGNLGQF